MNLTQTASLLKNMPDTTLGQLAQGSHPEIPQYLVMAEMQRRKSMRSEATGMASQGADQTSVKDDLLAQQQPQHPDPYAAPPVPQFASGGMVGDDDTVYTDQGIPLTAPADTYSVPDPSKWVVPLPRFLQFGIDDMIGNDQRDRQAAAKAQQKKLADRRAGHVDMPAPPPIPSGAPMANPVPTIDPFEYDGAAPVGSGKPAAKAKGSSFDIDAYAPPPVPKQSAPGQGTSAMAKNPFADDTTDASDQGIASLQQLPDKVEKPKFVTPDDYLGSVQKALPGANYDGMVADYDKKKQANKDNRQQAMGMALMQAGFGMAASKSPYFLSALGEGGLRGTQSFQDSMQQIEKQDQRLDEQKQALQLAKEAAAQGQYKIAADLANHANTTNYHMYDVDRKERGDDIRSQRAAAVEDRKDKRYAQNLKYQYDKLDQQERLRIDAMDRQDRNAYLRLKAQMSHYEKMYDKPSAEQRTTQWLMGADIDDPARREMEAQSRQKAYSTLQGLKSQPKDMASLRRDYDKAMQNPIAARLAAKQGKDWSSFEGWLNSEHPDVYGGRGAQPAGSGGFKILNVQ